MTNNKQAYPLSWPKAQKRTVRPSSSKFKTSLTGALNNMNKSLSMFASDSGHKVENILVSSNVTLGELKPKDSGVAVYFSWNGLSTCIAVDLYTKVEDNLQAIHKCIEADRVKLRHGGIHMVTESYRGYAALPPGTGSKREWYEVLNIYKGCAHEVAEAAYKNLRSIHHPDKKTGNKEKFNEVQQAWSDYKVYGNG